MDSLKDKKQFLEIENKRTANHLNDDPVVFVPAENIRAIERVINNWEEVKQQWNKMKQDSKAK